MAAIIGRIDLGCASNPMLVLISLTAAFQLFLLIPPALAGGGSVTINARPVVRFQAGLENLIYRLNGN